MHSRNGRNGIIDENGIAHILELRLLVARAAATDALQWWDDESLTDGGMTLTGRIFPRRPERAAVRLAMRAARSRHAAALERFPGAVHLFNLSERFEIDLDAALAFEDLGPLRIPPPVETIEGLRDRLAQLGISSDPAVSSTSNDQVVQIERQGRATELDHARALAAAYLAGKHGKAVFPYILPNV